MPSAAPLLGPLPLLRGLLRWCLAALFVIAAWHLYLWYPLPGLVAIGIAPVVVLFLFFRGLNLVSRTLPYWKTRRALKTLRLRPTWSDTGAGYFFVDEQRGLWVVNGVSGRLTDITRLRAHTYGIGHRLDLFTRAEGKAAVSYGFPDAQTLRDAAERFRRACFAHSGKDVPVTYEGGENEEETPPPHPGSAA